VSAASSWVEPRTGKKKPLSHHQPQKNPQLWDVRASGRQINFPLRNLLGNRKKPSLRPSAPGCPRPLLRPWRGCSPAPPAQSCSPSPALAMGTRSWHQTPVLRWKRQAHSQAWLRQPVERLLSVHGCEVAFFFYSSFCSSPHLAREGSSNPLPLPSDLCTPSAACRRAGSTGHGEKKHWEGAKNSKPELMFIQRGDFPSQEGHSSSPSRRPSHAALFEPDSSPHPAARALERMLGCWRGEPLPHSPSCGAASAAPGVSPGQGVLPPTPVGVIPGHGVLPPTPVGALGRERWWGKASRNGWPCLRRVRKLRGDPGRCGVKARKGTRTATRGRPPSAVPRCPEGLMIFLTMLASPTQPFPPTHPPPRGSAERVSRPGSHLVGRSSPRWGPCSSGSPPARRSAAARRRGPPAPPAAAPPRSAPPRRPPPPRPRRGTRRAPRRRARRSPAARRARG